MALFKKIDFPLSALIESIAMGQIGLPDLQRPFVWPNTKVRDLFDSMYRGYPVGYLLLWENGATDGARTIGTDRKQTVPQLLVIDGQQRLTSLFSVLRGVPVKRQNFSEEKIAIAFRPLDGGFEVADAAIRRDVNWIPDISVLWNGERTIFDLVGEYLERLSGHRSLDDGEKRRIQNNIGRLSSLSGFPFTALQLSGNLDEAQVAEVFVRINSKGTPLNQADFILTLMSVFRDDLRAALERFCREARVPASGKPSPFNHFIEPDPDHLLRVSVGLGFRRARLQHVYSILRGKDLESGEFSEERREEQFRVLEKAQSFALDLQHWSDFLKCLLQAGFRSWRMVSSRNALLYSYVYYLIGKRDYEVGAYLLRNAIARWFFFVALTGRYTESPESRMEQDLADLREVRTAEAFLQRIERTIAATFTSDYWSITLPAELATSSARSPALFAYHSALNLLDARALFSQLKVSGLMDPSTQARRSDLERHHLFPKAHLHRLGVRSRRDINQIANYALIEWKDNEIISDSAPADYLPRLLQRSHIDEEERVRTYFWHALPEGWETMEYQPFLEERRRRIAAVIRAGFGTLQPGDADRDVQAGVDSEPAPAASLEPIPVRDRLRELLDAKTMRVIEDLLEEEAVPAYKLRAEVAAYLARLELEKDFEGTLDIETAREVAGRCTRLLDHLADTEDGERQYLVQAAAMYFVLDDDAESDLTSPNGFDDDRAVVEAVETVLGALSRGA